MSNTERNTIYKFPFGVKALISIGVITAIVGMYAYYDRFGSNSFWHFGNQESFGLFGDYLEGLLNPILTFFTVVLLIWSVQIQVQELQKSTQVLKETKTAHEEQLDLSLDESIRKQLHDNANMHIENSLALLNKPLFLLPKSREQIRVSVHDTYRNTQYYGDSRMEEIIHHLKELMSDAHGITAEKLHLYQIKNEVDFSVALVCDLIEHLKLNSLKNSWASRVETLIIDCEGLNLITSEKASEWKLALSKAKETANNNSRKT